MIQNDSLTSVHRAPTFKIGWEDERNALNVGFSKGN